MQTLRPIHFLFAGALFLSSACQSSGSSSTPSASAPSHAQITNEATATAEVTAVDSFARLITLRREDGSLFRVQAGDSVRNFSQIVVGDALRVKYTETLSAKRLGEGEAATPANATLAAARSKAGAKPAGGVGAAISLTVRIESIDREHEIVVFGLPSGELFSRRVATSEGREFVKGLKPGDRVQLDYAEVAALSIEKL